ncbi:thioredoxin-like protein [Trypanosoma brucei gambiense DAL972]|uniref:Thioredoxin-like protein n=2 Tax=Trypanosoma brucei TaxID=5691 RepID=C9ZNL5_TRYB9|nr:thioredoxin-like protein [Trypanosoma brucei gambiense DAL972]RHW72306.1 monothiol glutaredoxin [Trypanosoma brucei equiperdum]CBH10993.1 thioredoxin-like protein [Trypanosoma brucei gambiense DAL972]|eukprot:XP_011773280.1 thioredoxin-like protein [Trypanosoma brucei gambiense DAL972]
MKRVGTLEEYTKVKRDANGLGLVVHFSASWCEPCKGVTEALDRFSELYKGSVEFVEVDSEALGSICEAEAVDCVPYIAFFRTSGDGKGQERVADVVGGKLDQIEQNMLSLYGDGTDGRGSFSDLQSYLKYLTSRKGVVAFITGTPSRPRCGFTVKLIQLLDDLHVKYVYYDVWASDEVCEGLKKYSEWPTFPQVYADGEFIGGYDICAELNASGELKSALKL